MPSPVTPKPSSTCGGPSPPVLTPTSLLAYMSRYTALINQLLADSNKDRALARLEILRQEINIVSGTPYTPLSQDDGVTTDGTTFTISTVTN